MTTCRPPRDDDEVGITTVFCNMLLYPSDGLLNVDDLGGIRISGCQSIINRYTNPAHLNHAVQQGLCLFGFVPNHPGTAMDLKEYRATVALSNGLINIQKPALARI